MSIFAGSGALVDEWLGLTFKAQPPLYQTETAWEYCRGKRREDFSADFVERLFKLISQNVQQRTRKGPASEDNWRFTQRPNISLANRDQETILERAIVRGAPPDLANQSPVASGVCMAKETKNDIDLLQHFGEGDFAFIELKVGSNHPLYAAVEILCYAGAYVAARQHSALLGYDAARTPLLAARRIRLEVLAPRKFYIQHRAETHESLWLQPSINEGLKCVPQMLPGLSMNFQFTRFPDAFRLEAPPAQLREWFLRRQPMLPGRPV